MKSTSTVYLSLGSNIGNRILNLRNALHELQNILADCKVSRVYETLPLYFDEQRKFLNIVVKGKCSLDPFSLLTHLHEIEYKQGRRREKEVHNGPRTIDIDILLFGDEVISTEELKIPHPGIRERKFVLVPLLELDPHKKDPVSNIKYWKILTRLPEQGIYYYTVNGMEA